MTDEQKSSDGATTFVFFLGVILVIFAIIIIGWVVDKAAYTGVTIIFWVISLILYVIVGFVFLCLTAIAFDLTRPLRTDWSRRKIKARSIETLSHPTLREFKEGRADNPFDSYLVNALRRKYVESFGRDADENCFGNDRLAYEQFRKSHLMTLVSTAEAQCTMDTILSDLHGDFVRDRFDDHFYREIAGILRRYEPKPEPFVTLRNVLSIVTLGRLSLFPKVRLTGRKVGYYKQPEHKGEFIKMMGTYIFALLSVCPDSLNKKEKLIEASANQENKGYWNSMKALGVALPPGDKPRNLLKGVAGYLPEAEVLPQEVRAKTELERARELLDGAPSHDNTKAVLDEVRKIIGEGRRIFDSQEMRRSWQVLLERTGAFSNALQGFEEDYERFSKSGAGNFEKWFIDAQNTAFGEREIRRVAKVNYFKARGLI